MLTQYWYLWLVFGALVIVTAVVIVFASRAVSSHNAETKRQLEELQRLKQLKDKYKNFYIETLENADKAELLEGVTAVLQARVEKAADAEAEFKKFTDPQKYIYTLYYFLEDYNAEGLSFFFKNNGDELRSIAADAFRAVGYDSAVPPVNSLWAMFDENNETVSIDNDEMLKTDSQFETTFDEDIFLTKIKKYVIANSDSLKSQG